MFCPDFYSDIEDFTQISAQKIGRWDFWLEDGFNKMDSVQVPTPIQATLIYYIEIIIVVVEMIYFGGHNRPPSSDLQYMT